MGITKQSAVFDTTVMEPGRAVRVDFSRLIEKRDKRYTSDTNVSVSGCKTPNGNLLPKNTYLHANYIEGIIVSVNELNFKVLCYDMHNVGRRKEVTVQLSDFLNGDVNIILASYPIVFTSQN